ncbi:MAG: hypothetical protein DCC55_11985 [Chloroflexi bacterium]|nr:MAG: hypothetical protein DCC55_11985 [Chloroflexota bacterium]
MSMEQRFEQTVVINAPTWVVWESLVRPDRMKEWMGEPEMELAVETGWNECQWRAADCPFAH